MLCERCFKKHATISITQIVNGKKSELNICEDCAKEEGAEASISNLPQIFTKMLLDVLKQRERDANLAGREFGPRKCSSCGYSWEDFRKSGLLGCDKCYVSFKQPLADVVKQIHGTARHTGEQAKSKQKGKSAEEIRAILEGSLREAVLKEEYEKAAEIRDKIRSLKRDDRIS
jgi:protein arginine kinase activator